MAKAGTDERNQNSGALFINDKGDNDRRPDYTGKLSLKVDDYEIDEHGNVLVILAAWEKENDNIGKFFSIKASPPRKPQA